MTFSVTTLSKKGLFTILSLRDTQHKRHSALCCASRFIFCYAECHYVEYCNGECHYAEGPYAECHYADLS